MSVNTSMPSISTQYPEAKSLCDHTNSAANEARTIWFGFLTYGTFLVVAVAGTTHKMLFLQAPISLPILSINLDLVGFYVAAPLLLFVLHLYLLVKLVLLSESYANFEAQVERDIKPSTDKTQIRKHLNTTVFVQALKAQRTQRSLLGFLLSLLLFLTLSAGPVTALFYTQIRFLPYQSWEVTLLHRVLFAFDLGVLLGTFEATFRNRGFLRPLLRRWLAYSISVALIGISFLVTFPGEWIDANPLAKLVLPTRDIGPIQTTSLDRPFPTTLKLANEQFVAEMKFDPEKLQSTLSFRDRSLIGADLQRTDMRKVVFEDADLRGANLSTAQMQGANLERAQLQGAHLKEAKLQGANLELAELQGADLKEAKLQGANLRYAELQGADLRYAELQGADLKEAKLQGAYLRNAELQGANLRYAELQGADLRRAELQGAVLNGAQLQGAHLRYAELQGADLSDAALQGANLSEAYVWRSRATKNSFADSVATAIETAPVSANLFSHDEDKPLDEENVAALTSEWLAKIPDGDRKIAAEERMKILYPENQSPEVDLAIRDAWQEIATESVSQERNHRARLEIFTSLACSPAKNEFSPDPADIAEAFATPHILVDYVSEYAPTFAHALLKPACAGHGGLSDKSKACLKGIVAEADNSE